MTDAIVTFALETVMGIVKKYADLIGGAKGELKELQNELEGVKACLKDAAEKTGMGHHFNLMKKQMREAIYDVEDALNTYLTDLDTAAAKRKKNYLKEKAKEIAGLKTTVDMAKTVKDLRTKLEPIYRKAREELARPGSFTQGSLALVKKDVKIRRDKLVTLEDVENTIFGYLAEETKALDYISIIGRPGLGKTTLTCNIFDSDTNKDNYRIRIWVNVSQNFNKKDVLLQILKQFNDNDMSGMDSFDLERQVRNYLHGPKYLIVLDDVWTVKDLDDIKSFLPANNVRGKVIITSRSKDVGTSAGRRKPYELRDLTREESWKLLQLEVFGNESDCPDYLKVVGEKIAVNCDGLPLTIVVIGGILVAMDTRKPPRGIRKKEWTTVSEDVIRFLATDKDKRILEAVALSYDILPDELKECFVYMGVFPGDHHEIPAWILIRLWIAEGFVVQKEDQSIEETAEEYLNDLINRNLLVIGRTNPMGENKTCGVHDMIHVFCTSKGKEHNLFQEIKTSNQGVSQPPEKYHRICFNSDLNKFLDEGTEYPRVRSFLSFYKDPVKLEAEYINAIPSSFELLRVLNSNTIIYPQIPPTIDELSHLRYLTLYVDKLKTIPKAISKLRNLQTFLVDTNSTTPVEMKANLWVMLWLRHFKTKAAIVLGEEKEGEGGKNIQTLTTLSPESCTETVAKKACNMKELHIRGNLSTLLNGKNNFLGKLPALEKLKLENDQEAPIRLLNTNCFPRNLKRLTLRKTFLEWSSMHVLAELEKLEVLKLKDNAFNGKLWRAVGDGFPSLHFLLIAQADLEIWEASADHFPSLTCLTIKKCRKLETIPQELAKELQKLEVESLKKSATDSAREIQKEKDKDQAKENVRWGSQFQLFLR
ncbi:hypothetical protein ABFS83_04G149100 [Erythranthe nasuta]